MTLLIGQPMNGRDLEQATSPWPPERFASMCDALAWAISGRQCSRPPSFTAQVNAKDGGIDAEWSVELPDDGHPVPTPILGPGWNVFQYKKRDLIAQDRRRIIANLKSSLTGAVSDIVKKTKRHPDRYVLFVNVDLKGSDKFALQESILKGYSDQSKVHVHIVGAGELVAFLNNHPHLRAAYFTEGLFKTWEEAHRAHLNQKLIGADVELVGREEEMSRLRSLVDDARVRVIVLSGPHDMGKSRLTLEATRHRPHDVVQALDPRSMDLSDYRSLGAMHGEVICIVEDPESDAIEPLVNEALSLPNFKLIVALPTPAHAPAPAYGRDERVQALHLQPLQDAEARKLLEASGQPLDFDMVDWMTRHAGGVPGVLLAAASVGNTLRHDLTSFVDAVGHEFERRIQSEIGVDALKCARLFSVLTHVGISGTAETELKHICDLFGEDWTSHTALISLRVLERVGLARRGGSFAEITLPLLANYLVSQLLQGRQFEMLALFGRLDNSGRMRFVKRLSEIKSVEVERFWDEFFAPDGPLGNFQKALDNVYLLRRVTGTVPERILRLLETGLRNSSRDERLAIRGDQRSELKWALDQLLFRRKTSRGAIRLLWLLAEAENEGYTNNATGIVAECFYAFHPQVPLSLRERLDLLRAFTAENTSETGKLVAIKAIKAALSGKASVMLRHSTGPEPLDSGATFTYDDFCDYACHLGAILMSLAQNEGEVARVALAELPELTADIGMQARPQEALEHFSMLVEWARSGRPGLEVSSLIGALRRMHKALSTILAKPEFPSERRDEFQACLSDLDRLESDLETASFATRLQRWAGKWAYGDHEDESSSDRHSRFTRELTKLADEVVENPSLLSLDLVEWLLSSPSQRTDAFFFFLGASDEGLFFRECIEALGSRPDGAGAFSAYWSGWAQRDQNAAEKRLDQLTSSNAVTGVAIVLGTVSLGIHQGALSRIIAQIHAGRVDPEYAGRVVVGKWLEKLTENQFEELIRAVAGDNFEHGASVVDMLHRWSYAGKPLQGNLASFAWQCIGHDIPIRSSIDAWKFDQLAARLAHDDSQRGFELMKNLLQRYEMSGNSWDPLEPYGDHAFWKVLYATDKKCLVDLLLNLAQTDVLRRHRLSRRLRELLDQEEDKELLLSFAIDNVENARIIASFITSSKEGFWPMAFTLVQRYPHDEELLSHLTTGVEQLGTAMWGSVAQFYATQKQEVEQRFHESSTPPEARAWLREVLSRLEREVPRQTVWEYDIDVDDLRVYIRDKNSTQRLWAIGRVLKYATWEDLRRLLTVEDIEEALPYTDLPEQRRKTLEKALEIWR
jgi:hypothetical protein